MQEGYEDYSIRGYNSGCCLYCSSSSPGCLCFDCKCSQCYWYNAGRYGGKGFCEKVDILREDAKKKYIEQMKIKQERDNFNFKKQLEDNKKILNEMLEKKIIPKYYSCQYCQNEIISESELDIIKGKEPLCFNCQKKRKDGESN